MAIIFTGTIIGTVNHTTTHITKVVHTGTTVFTPAPLIHKWVYIYETSSEPDVDLGPIESSSDQSYWLSELNALWPPNNYPIGTTACVWDGYYTIYYTYQIQGE